MRNYCQRRKEVHALTLGGFIEGDWGQDTTHNSFADMPAVRGKGESSYVGGGVLARYAFHKGKMKGLALEASFRAGKTQGYGANIGCAVAF